MPAVNIIFMSYSHSSLASYEGCKLKFKYTYIDHWKAVPELPNKWAAKGLAFHESVEFWKKHSDLINKDINTQADLEELMKFNIAKYNVEDNMNVLSGAPIFIVYYNNFVQPKINDGYKEEHEYCVRGDIAGNKFVGYIDVFLSKGNKFCIYDYKTAKSINADSYKSQLLLYAYLIGLTKGMTTKQITENAELAIIGPLASKANAEKPATYFYPIAFTEQDLIDEISHLSDTIKAVQSENWDNIGPVSGSMSFACNFCPYKCKGANPATGFPGCKITSMSGMIDEHPEIVIAKARKVV